MPQILVIEGDTFTRKLYCEFLRAEGFSVSAVPDPTLALAALADEAADVLVARFGGTEPYATTLLQEARRRAPRVDLIALVDRGSVDAAARALREGACEYLLKPVTRQALGLAVRRCLELQRLLAERPQMARELALYRRCQALAFSGVPEGLEERVAEALCQHAQARAAVVLRQGEHGEEHVLARVAVDQPTAEKVAAAWHEKRRGGKRSGPRELGEPLVVEVPGRFVVALYGMPKKATRDEDEMRLLARWAGLATELAARYGEAAGADAAIDPLSGLYDQRYLVRVLDEEIARAKAGGPPVAALAIDVDGFKAINDAHGHLVGSRALIEAARILERCVREVDVIARPGADEFNLLLLHTDATGARGAAERIRRAFESHLFLVREGLDLRLTVSIGVAECPKHGSTAHEVLDAAERAVAALKQNGKNRVGVAE